MRLQAKLALALVPLVAGPVLALGLLAYTALRADIERNAAEDLRGVLHVATRSVEGLVSRSRANLQVFVASPSVEQYARASGDEDRFYLFQPGLLRQLHLFRQPYPEYREIRFLLPDGTVDARAAAPDWRAGHEAGDVDQRTLGRAAGEEVLTMGLYADDIEPVLELAYRIELPDAYGTTARNQVRPRGFLAMTVSLEPVYRDLRGMSVDFRGFLLLVLPDGRVLFDSRAGLSVDRLASGLERLLPDPGSGQAEQRLIEASEWLGGSQAVSPGLRVIAVLPRGQLEAPLAGLKLQTLGLTLAATLLLGMLLLAWLRRLVLAPLAALRGATERIGAGDLEPVIPIRSSDELGELATAVRHMGERLALAHGQVEHQALHDQLTDLPNRRLIRELMADELGRARRNGGTVAALFVDIDHFKRINDALGHALGDELLRVVARRLGGVLLAIERPRRGHLARLGGDELLIVLAGSVEPNVAGDVASAVLAAVAEPVDLGDLRQVVTASIGVALYPRDAGDADGLIRAADLAMYAAKADGRNAIRFYAAELNARVAARLRLENALRHAVERSRLSLHYQPIVALATGRAASFEALLRWRDADLGHVPPGEFIPIAEDTGMILDIGRWVLGEVCRQIAAWRADGLVTAPVAVNVSAVQLNRENLAPLIAALLLEHGLGPGDLAIEVTESVLMALDARSEERFMALRSLGVAVYIDDFGTGYSSLSYLRRFQFDCVKIDASFVRGVTDAGDDRILVTAIVALAHALDIRVVAEGIERPEQAAALAELGCDLGQGYHYARPMPQEVAGRLAGRRLPLTDAGAAAAEPRGAVVG